jgi:hypothetical protein
MKKSFLIHVLVFMAFGFQVTVNAQWSADPFENLEIMDTDGMLVVPHVAVLPSGNSYISWYSATEGLRFDVYLQYLDNQGIKQWPEPGLLVSNHETDTWVSDYGLEIDQEGCAVLVTQDIRDGFGNSFAYRISPEGQMKWGPDGIRLTEGPEENYWPQVIETPGNDFIFINNMFPLDTTQISTLNLKKISKEGNLLWNNTVTMELMDLYFGRLLITEDGNLMVSYLGKDNYPDTVIGQQHYVHVFLQKFDLDGNSLWASPVQADSGDVMIYGALFTIPYLANDGADGAYVVWQSFAEENPTTLVNHVNAEGNLTWPGYGTPVSTNYYNDHTSPSVSYNPDLDRLFVFWQEYHYDGIDLEDCWGIAGQKFSPDGDRLWSDTAKFLVPLLCAIDTALMAAHISPGPENSLFFTYEKEFLLVNASDTTISGEIYGSLVDADGNYLWQDQVVPVTLAIGNKIHCYLSQFAADQWIIAWDDSRNHSEDPWNSGIYAQNITIDGNLGPLFTDEILSDKTGLLRGYPNPCSDLVNIEYELNRNSEITISIYDCLGNVLFSQNKRMQEIGKHMAEISMKTISHGVYFIILRSQDYSRSIRVIKKN